jgi:hypothetical protein
MANVTWTHPKPAPNPFEAVAGDFTKHAVHLCDAHAHKNEEVEILASVLEPALETAEEVKRPEARFVLFTFDAVYSMLTIVVTDAKRTRDEREVFKLIFREWDHDMQEGNVADSEVDKRCEELNRRMHSLLDSTLRQERFAARVAHLKTRGFEFWFSDGDPDGKWESVPA